MTGQGDLLPIVVQAIMRPSEANALTVVRAMESAPQAEYEAVKAGLFDAYPEKAHMLVLFFSAIDSLRGGLPIKESSTIPES